MKEPLTQDLSSPSAERIRPQESGPEDQHKDEGLEVGGHQAAKSKARGSRFLPGSHGHQGSDSALRSLCFSFFLCPCDPALFSFLCPFDDEGQVFLVHLLWGPEERVLVRVRHHPPRHVDWPVNPRNPPASDFSALGLQMFHHAQRFHTDSGDRTGAGA